MAETRRKWGILSVSLLLLALGTIFVVGFFPLSLPPVERSVVSLLEKYVGNPVDVEKVWLVPWKGVRVRGLRFATMGAGGFVAEVGAEDVFLHYRLKRVLGDRARLRRLLQRGASNRGATVPKSGEWEAVPPASSGGAADLIKRLSARRVDIAVYGGAQELVVARGAKVRLAAKGETLQRCSGRFEARRLGAYGTWNVDRPSARFDIGDSILAVEGFRGKFCGGSVKGGLWFQRRKKRVERCEVSLNRLDLHEWYASTGLEEGQLTGWLDLRLRFDPAPLIPDSIAGTGSFEIKDMVADNIPLQRTLVMLLALPGLSHVEFDRVRSPLKVEGGKIYTQMEATGEPLAFNSDGWTRLDGYFRQEVSGLLSEEFVDTLRPIIRSGLVRQEDGRRLFECTVRGTFEDPRLTLKQGTVRRAVRSMFRSLGGSLRLNQRD